MASKKNKKKSKNRRPEKKPSDYEKERKEVAARKAREAGSAVPGSGNDRSRLRKIIDRFSTFFMSGAILMGYISFIYNNFVGDNEVFSYIAMALFVISAVITGMNALFGLVIGGALGVLLSMQFKVSPFMTIAFIWSLFYTVMMVAGFLMTRKQRK